MNGCLVHSFFFSAERFWKNQAGGGEPPFPFDPPTPLPETPTTEPWITPGDSTPSSGRRTSRLDLSTFVCRETVKYFFCYSEELQVCVVLVSKPKPVSVLAVRTVELGEVECESFDVFQEIKRY